MNPNQTKSRKKASRALRRLVLRARTRYRLNQRDFARQCKVSLPTIWRLERGMTVSTASQLRIITGTMKFLLNEEKKKLRRIEEGI
jgi:transcriptional regulator with XRE-family HTH domain